MKGYYRRPEPPPPPREEDVLYGCKRCPSSWYEKRLISPLTPRINSAIRCYDFCSQCITEHERKQYEPGS